MRILFAAFLQQQLPLSFLVGLAPLTIICAVGMAQVDLPMNDINIVVVTDVHGWVASRKRHEPQLDADYGHVLSFYERLREACVAKQHNLLFVMNGDFTDGTGLSAFPPSHLTPILKKMPWDALNIGNHELYSNATIKHITEDGFADFWGTKYVTSNVLRAGEGRTLKPLGGSRHIVWEGPTAKVLIFGFLYDMTDNSPLVIVDPVEQVLEQPWFASALGGDYQAIVCLVHMDVSDPLISAILARIRSIVGDFMPVQFISGHSHIQSFERIDEYSTSFEAGHYMDTIGFVSFGSNGTNFQHVFIDANVERLQSILGVDNVMTDNGTEVQSMILAAQEQLGLLDTVGCSPDHFQLDVEISHPQSFWRFFMDRVITEYFFRGSPSSVYVQSSGSFRYDLYEGKVSLDDIISVSPFNDTIALLSTEVKGSQMIQILQGQVNSLQSSVPWSNIDPQKSYALYTAHFDVVQVGDRLLNITGRPVDPEYQNVTTTDLLLNFVAVKWPCGENRQESRSPFWLICLVLPLCILAVVVVAVRRKRAFVVNDMSRIATEERAGMPDDSISDDEFMDDLI